MRPSLAFLTYSAYGTPCTLATAFHVSRLPACGRIARQTS